MKSDKFLAEFPSDKILPLEDLYAELEKRNKETDAPINLLYESKSCWNVTYIDTPGLKQPGEPGAAEREALIMEYAKPQDRILIFVEESKDWENVQMAQLAEKLDPKITRSVFVYSKLHFELMRFTSAGKSVDHYKIKPERQIHPFHSLSSYHS